MEENSNMPDSFHNIPDSFHNMPDSVHNMPEGFPRVNSYIHFGNEHILFRKSSKKILKLHPTIPRRV